MDISIINALIIFLVGIIVGVINTLAGSGSLITLPILIFLGLDANIANGTNRIAIFFQTLTGVFFFKKEKILQPKTDYKLAIPVIIGAIPGAFIASIVPAIYIEKFLGIIFLIMPIFILFNPKNWNKKFDSFNGLNIKPIHYFLLFLIGFYGGFIQAGVGIFMLFALVSGLGINLIKANALKIFLTFIFTPIAILIFWNSNQIDWTVGLILALGNSIGAIIGVKLAIKKGSAFIKWIVIIMVVFSAIYFLIK